LATLLCGFSAFARDHSALNGTWTLVPAKSDFAGQSVVQTGTVPINDRQGIITEEAKKSEGSISRPEDPPHRRHLTDHAVI
jgi:hypothetical protein